MAGDYFLKIDGVPGEATDEKHKQEIDILTFSFGVSQETGKIGSGQGAGKATFNDLSFTAEVNKASPVLMLKCATGEHIKEATLVARRAGGKQNEYFTVKLTDVFVSSFNNAGAGGSNSVPVDQFSLNYTKIEFSYAPQDNKGGLGGPVKSGYNLKTQAKA